MPWRLPPLNTIPPPPPKRTETATRTATEPQVSRWKKLLPIGANRRAYDAAVRQLEAGQWDAAIVAFEKLAVQSHGGPLTGELARFYLCEAHLSQAVCLFEAAPDDAGMAQKALEHLTQAAHLGPQYADVFYQQGRVLLRHCRDTEAMIALDRTVDLNPGYARAHLLRGILLYRGGEREGCLLLVEVAVSLDAALPVALLARAREADAQNNVALALRLLLQMGETPTAAGAAGAAA